MTALDNALLEACRAKPADVEVIRDLLERGADPSATSYHSHALHGDTMTGLHSLGLHRDNPTAAAALLLDAGARLDARSERRQWTPLHTACAWNHLALVRLYLERGADLDALAKDRDSGTPLVACINANAELCLPTLTLLLEAGADPNLRPESGVAALDKAVDVDNLEIVRALLAAGADPNADVERPPLHLALLSKRGGPVARALLEAGADVHARRRGRPAIHEAALRTQTTHLELLAGFGADFDARDHEGHTPLMAWLTWLQRATPVDLVEDLLARGVDVGACDEAGTPTLHLALRKGEAAVIEALVRGGADPRQTDAAGVSAIELARELNPLLVTALGVREVVERPPPTQLALQAMRAGATLTCAGGALSARESRPKLGGSELVLADPLSEARVREQIAWCLLHADADADAIVQLLAAAARSLGLEAHDRAELVSELRSREPSLVDRCELELLPEHGPALIEAAVRAGYEPCRSDKEGFWVWRFEGGPEDRAFQFKEAGDHLPEGASRRTDAADLRQFFSGFSVEHGRLGGGQRRHLDEALRVLGCDSERLWLLSVREPSG